MDIFLKLFLIALLIGFILWLLDNNDDDYDHYPL